MKAHTWKSLYADLRELYDSGRPMRGPRGAVLCFPDNHGLGDHVRIYRYKKPGAVRTLRSWLRRAHDTCCAEQRTGARKRIDGILRRMAGLSLAESSRLRLRSFTPKKPAHDQLGKWVQKYYIRNKFNLLLEMLLKEAKALAKSPPFVPPPDPEQEFWTIDQLAEFRGVARTTIIKEVSYYRRDHGGKNPIWVRGIPGRRRGFKIMRKVYLAQMRAGHARGPARSRLKAA